MSTTTETVPPLTDIQERRIADLLCDHLDLEVSRYATSTAIAGAQPGDVIARVRADRGQGGGATMYYITPMGRIF